MSANETNTNVRDITALANQVDAGQIPTTTCDSPQGVVTIAQNGPVSSPNANNVPTNTPNANNVPTNTPNANTAPAAGPNAENIADQPNGSQSEVPPTAPMTPTSGLTPAS